MTNQNLCSLKNNIQEQLCQTDIYLIDQILKGRYNCTDKILDAGCGNGRNMNWFLQNGYDITGIDMNMEVINFLKDKYKTLPIGRFIVSTTDSTNFADDYFHHIISSAVLHFANNSIHFNKMIAELARIVKPEGSLFIRMASNIGIEEKVIPVADGVYLIPDGTKRFLLTRTLLADFMQQNKLVFIEPLKTVNVDDTRCMSTLVLQKK